jgi:hypothetical protein
MERVELGCVIARRDFGPVVGSVVRVVLLNPGLRLVEIHARSKPLGVQPRLVDDSLAILVNHGICYAEARTSARQRPADEPTPNERGHVAETVSSATPLAMDGGRKRKRTAAGGISTDAVVVYKVYLDRLLLRTRSNRYAHLALLLHGDGGLKIARLLLERGRLTASDILQAAFRRHGASEQEVDAAERQLIVMVKSGFLRWAGSIEDGPVSGGAVHLLDDECDHRGSAKSKGDNVPSISDAEDDGDSGNPDIDSLHPSLTAAEMNDMDPAYNVHTGKLRVGFGVSAKFLRAPLQTNATDAWMICTWRLNMHFRNYCCAEVVRGLLNADRADARAVLPNKVFKAGLNLAVRMEEPDVLKSLEETAEVGIGEIRDELDRGGLDITDDDFAGAIHTLLRIKPIVAIGVPADAPVSLVFLTGRMVALSRQQTMEDTLLEKHSRTGLRIWRALAVHGCMQEKMLSDMTMLGIKSVREYLYKMAADGYVTMQEVPKSNEPVRADRSNTVWYLWRADVAAVFRRMLADALFATRRLMLKCEEIKSAPLLDEPDAASKRAKAVSLLDATVCRCDTLVMLFRDFGEFNVDSFRTLYKTEADLGKGPKVPMY